MTKDSQEKAYAQKDSSKQYEAPKRKKPTGIIIAIALLVLVVVMAQLRRPSAKPEQITVALDYTPNTNHTGMYVAQELGYYKDAGLDVVIVQPAEDGADAMVATGSAQFGVSYQDVMANYLGSENPLPVSAIATILQHNTSGIMSSSDSQITRPRDMENHIYATWNIPVEQAIVRTVVEDDGGVFDKVKLVPYTTTDEIQSLRTGDFQCVWVYEGWAGQNAKIQQFKSNYFAFKDINPVFDYYTPVIIASNEYLASHPEDVQKFLDATKRGYEYASTHPEEAADILMRAIPELDRSLVEASQEYLADVYTDNNGEWGRIDPQRWNNFYIWMNDNNLTSVPLTNNIGLNTSFMN